MARISSPRHYFLVTLSNLDIIQHPFKLVRGE